MSRHPGVAALALLILVLPWSCQDGGRSDAAVEATAGSAVDPPTTLPLKEIMSGLERDLTELLHGVWVDDAGIVATAAGRIADHPRVPPEQMSVIQTTLATEFAAFVQMDRAVHDGAVALASAADSSRPAAELFAASLGLQEGCFACHARFRPQVIDALTSVGGR